DNAITSRKIKTGNVKNSDVADGAITKYKIAAGAVTGSRIANGAIATVDLSDEVDDLLPEYIDADTYNLNFNAIPANSCTETDQVFTTALPGDSFSATPMPTLNGVEDDTDTSWTVWSNEMGHVILRICNSGTEATHDIAQQIWAIRNFTW
ncbi:MAG: hypothetical protein PHI88_01510, partial [Candidatus Pacebacteria bacterium]|nr:hypothetical protein [Candidatus Paceibacterota bacterium]